MALKLLGGRLTIGKTLSPYVGQTDNLFGFMRQRYGVDYRSRNKLKAYKNVVYGCSSLIGEALGDYAPYLEVKKGEVWERQDHEFIDLLKQPAGPYDPKNPRADSFSSFNLWEAVGIYQVLQGDAFLYMARGKTTGLPREIILLRADKIGTDIDPDTGKVNGYFIRQMTGDPIPLEIDEVLRFPLFNPENPYKGKSVVEAGSDYIETDEGTAEFTKNFFKNGAGISGVLNVKGEVTKGAFRKFVRAWREKYEGAANAGKIVMLRDSDASFEKVGLGLDELDMASLRSMSMEDVMMMFKVPPVLLGKISDGNGFGRANVETQEYIFAKWNIDKKMKRFDAIIMFALQRYYGLDTSQYRVCHENIIPEDKEHELAERTAGVDKWYTRNEIRASEEAAAVDGGDQLFVAINQIPVNEASANIAPAAPAKSAPIKIRVVKRITRTASLAPTKKKDSSTKKVSPAQAERFRMTLMRNQLRYEKQYKRLLAPIWKQQHAEVLNNLEAHSSSLSKAHEQKLFDDAAYDNLITNKLQPSLQDLAKTQGGLAMVFAGDDNNEFHLTSKIISLLERNTKKMATNYNDETLAQLNATLAEGIQAGEGIGQLKSRVSGVYENVEGYRAERIARTETLKASNNSTVEAYRQTGFVTSKVWVVNPDACPQCEEFDGKSIGLDDPFVPLGGSYTYIDESGEEQTQTNSYDTIEEPPLHPNCRCTIIPSTE
jgi:HK97 family phage portal protein